MKRAVTTAVLMILVAGPAVAQMYVVRRPIVATSQSERAELYYRAQLSASQTRYGAISYTGHGTATPAYFILPAALTPTRMDCSVHTALTAGTLTCQLYADGADVSGATCTIDSASNANSCSWSGSVSQLSAGTRLTVKFTTSSDELPASVYAYATVGGAESVTFVQTGGANSSTVQFTDATTLGKYCGPYTGIVSNTAGLCQEATAANAAMTATGALTLASFSMNTSGMIYTGDSVTFEVCKLGVGDGSCDSTTNGLTGLSLTLSPGTEYAYDTSCTDNCSLAAGERYVIKQTAQTGTPTGGGYYHMVVGVTGVGTQYQYRDTRTTSTQYHAPVNTMSTGQANVDRIVSLGGVAKNLRCEASAVPGTTVTYSVCVGATDTPTCGTLTCQMTTSDTTCSDTSNTLTVNAGNYVQIKKTSEGLSTGSNYCVLEIQP